jgi:hypothetical protein
MIEKTTAYKVGDKVFSTIVDAQIHEIEELFEKFPIVDEPVWNPHGIALRILEKQDLILDILTMTPNSKPKARAINGGRKPRKTKPESKTPAEPQA